MLRTETEVIQGDWNPEFHVPWKKWVEDRVIVACMNEATIQIFTKLISEVKIKGDVFKAWKEDEFPNLATLILPPGSKILKSDIWVLFLAQNGLSEFKGQYNKPRLVDLEKGWRKLSIGVASELASRIRALGGKAPLGTLSISAYCKKND